MRKEVERNRRSGRDEEVNRCRRYERSWRRENKRGSSNRSFIFKLFFLFLLLFLCGKGEEGDKFFSMKERRRGRKVTRRLTEADRANRVEFG